MNLSETIKRMGQPLEEKMNFSDKEVKMAIGVASDPRYKKGNMTGAVNAIEKIKKGLSDHPQVAAVLRRQNEEVELDEAMSGRTSERFQSAEAELIAYAKKSGGIDKGDFMDVAKMLGQIGRLNILQSGQVLSRLNRKLSNMDTDPRDKVYSILKQKGLMESLQEAPEDNEPASPDEGSMAMQQLEFIEYAADKIGDHIEQGGKFPEWMQNKLATVNDNMQSLYSQIDQDGEEMNEAKRDPSKSGGSGYDLYHKDFSSAMKHAYDYAKSKLGIEVDPKEIDDKVASGPRKPSKGKTNTYRLKGKDGKKAVQIQVANLDDKKFELNMYKESVDLEEAREDTPRQVARLILGMGVRQSAPESEILKRIPFALKKLGLQNDKLIQRDPDFQGEVIDDFRSMKEEVELDELKKYDKNKDYQLLNRLSQKAKTGKLTSAEKSQMANAKSRLRNHGFSEEVELEEDFYNVVYRDKKGKVQGEKEFDTKSAAEKYAKLGNSRDKVGGKYTVTLVRDGGMGRRNEEVEMTEEQANELFESAFGEEKLSLEDTLQAIWEGKLDPVNKKALKKDFDDRKDKDIDNDGDVDDSDEYMHKKRKAIGKSMEKDSDKAEADQEKEISDKEDEPKGKVGKSNKQTKVDVNPSIDEEKGEEMTSAEMEKKDEIMKSLEKKKDEFVKKYGDRAKEVMARTAIKMAKKHA